MGRGEEGRETNLALDGVRGGQDTAGRLLAQDKAAARCVRQQERRVAVQEGGKSEAEEVEQGKERGDVPLAVRELASTERALDGQRRHDSAEISRQGVERERAVLAHRRSSLPRLHGCK